MSFWIRGDRVRHISPDIIGATHGTVLATFTDLAGEEVSAVQWDGGYLGVTRTKWLDRIIPKMPTGAIR